MSADAAGRRPDAPLRGAGAGGPIRSTRPAPAPPTTPEAAPAAVPEPEHKLPEHLVRRLGNLADLAATERAEAEAPAAEAAPAPAATLEAPPDPAAVLAAMARLTWADANDGAECPAHRLPTSTDLAGWLPECPAAPWDEVAAAERAAGPGAVEWLSSVGGALAGASAADLEAGANMAAAHRQWRGAAVPRPPHPLRPLVDAWQRLAPVVMVADPRPHSVLPGTLAGRNGGLRPAVVSNDQRYLGSSPK